MEEFREIALSQIPRILGQGDRTRGSLTYGCFDRYYWHYKLHDFANVRFQEVCFLLAILYKYDFKGNVFYNKGKIREWAIAAVDFWARIQLSNGAFNEVYPFEYSFCATAFSTWAVCRCLIALGETTDRFKKALIKAGKWLAGNCGRQTANQVAASSCALHGIAQITNDDFFMDASVKKIEILKVMQDADGFFCEYGGGDVGYQSITLGCLTYLYYFEKNGDIADMIDKGLKPLYNLINEDGCFDAENTSRHTQFLYPLAFIYRAEDILGKIVNGLKKNRILSPAWMDDRYVIPFVSDYLAAYLYSQSGVLC